MILFKRSNVYYIKFIDEFGAEKRVSTKSKKKSDAVKFLSDFKKNIQEKPTTINISFIKAKDLFLNFCKIHHSQKYHSIIKYNLDNFFITISNKSLLNIHKHEIESFIHSKLIQGKIYTAHQIYRNLKTFFNWAKVNDYIINSPIEKIKAPKLPESKPLWITPEQLQIILSFVKNEILKDIFTILFYTGMRANELLSLDWKNIELDNKIIHVRNTEIFRTKTGAERSIPMNPKVHLIIQRQPTRFIGGLLFVNKNKVKFNVDYISKQFKKALKLTSINSEIHLHSLRHSFASNLIKRGESIYKVSKLLGHSKISTTEIYSHVNNEDLISTINAL